MVCGVKFNGKDEDECDKNQGWMRCEKFKWEKIIARDRGSAATMKQIFYHADKISRIAIIVLPPTMNISMLNSVSPACTTKRIWQQLKRFWVFKITEKKESQVTYHPSKIYLPWVNCTARLRPFAFTPCKRKSRKNRLLHLALSRRVSTRRRKYPCTDWTDVNRPHIDL